MQNVNANNSSNNANACGYPSVFPSPKPRSCEVLPYDGLAHRDEYNVYSSMADTNMLGAEKKYKYFRTCKVADQKNVWGSCKPRGGVKYNDNDHTPCDSRMDKDSVTEQSMMKACAGKYAQINGAYNSLMGNSISNNANANPNANANGYVYGAYTASGGFVEDMDTSKPKCDLEVNFQMKPRVPSTYVPHVPKKRCGAGNYRYANGMAHNTIKGSGNGSACTGLSREHEDHNEQYLKDHYAQYKSGGALPSQAELDAYKTDFTLLGDQMSGTTNYLSYGECANPGAMDPRSRADNAHIPQNTKNTPIGNSGRCA